jgi:hypothetical protein
MTTGYQWAKKTKTAELYAELVASTKGNKFGAKKVKLDGHSFDSQYEAKIYSELKLLERLGHISGLEIHPKFQLSVNGVEIASYKADFRYVEAKDNSVHVVDVKSPPTAAKRDFVLVRKLMRAIHGIDVEVLST